MGLLIDDLSLDAAGADLLHLLDHVLHFVEVTSRPLHLPHLLRPLDLGQQRRISLVKLVLVVLVEVLAWIINSIVHWLQVVVLVRLEPAVQGDSVFLVKSVELKFRGILTMREWLLPGSRKGYFHALVLLSGLVVHRKRVIQVRAVDEIVDIR